MDAGVFDALAGVCEANSELKICMVSSTKPLCGEGSPLDADF
jgi:hypothetical protein